MIASDFSFIIPVFNRPEEVRELLESFCALSAPKTFEIIIIEDGSTLDSKLIVDNYT
jgi:glycosyltransferase involved in cell wall biosynthesis